MKIEISAPSNIALIKYMGKTPGGDNRPTNSSLSWTLNHLRSFVRISPVEGSFDRWQPLVGEELHPISMSQPSVDRFLKHFHFLKARLGIEGAFLIESANNFPSDCGLASSASSFAALTLASQKLAHQMGQIDRPLSELAELSRQGSGSSCRSFFGPWVLWHSEGVRPLELAVNSLIHQVVIVEGSKKLVSSSEAHRRVATSSLFETRPKRAEDRLARLVAVLREVNSKNEVSQWQEAFEICWAEFWDMHALFETSVPAFGYLQPESVHVLRKVQSYWRAENQGPLVTMDAGANIHLLYRQDQMELANQIRSDFLAQWKVYS